MCGNCFAHWSTNLYILPNENDWCHFAWVTSPGQHKRLRKPFLALFSLPHWPAAGQAINMTEHILSLRFLASGKTSQHDRAHLLFFTDSSSLTLSLSYFEQSAKHHEESTPNLWTIGVWEIILSSFIFPSKPTYPPRNKLDIFNSCFDFSILILVLTTASQLLLGLQHFNPSPDDSVLIPALSFTTVSFFSTRVPFVSSCR